MEHVGEEQTTGVAGRLHLTNATPGHVKEGASRDVSVSFYKSPVSCQTGAGMEKGHGGGQGNGEPVGVKEQNWACLAVHSKV